MDNPAPLPEQYHIAIAKHLRAIEPSVRALFAIGQEQGATNACFEFHDGLQVVIQMSDDEPELVIEDES